MFGFLKDICKKIYTAVSSKLGSLFSKTEVDEATLKELEVILISADTGVKTTRAIIDQVRSRVASGAIAHGADLRSALRDITYKILTSVTPPKDDARVFIVVGINGSGKTTFVAKLAHSYAQQGKRVLVVAGDTFRAAAVQQLNEWATRVKVDILMGNQNQDPASVVYAGCDRFAKEQYDILIIDTAGRLQTKTNLMQELSKVRRTITKRLGDEPVTTLLTIDSMLGQNSLEQAQLFKEATQVTGIVLTKMDGSSKGGVVFSIVHDLQIPIMYVAYGESPEQFASFDARSYVDDLIA